VTIHPEQSREKMNLLARGTSSMPLHFAILYSRCWPNRRLVALNEMLRLSQCLSYDPAKEDVIARRHREEHRVSP
jgi:hypothetical protein